MIQVQDSPGRLLRPALFVLISIVVMMLAGAASANAQVQLPGSDVSCVGEQECLELAQRCTVFFAHAEGSRPETPTVSPTCRGEDRKLLCSGYTNCGALRELCLSAAGTYVETVGPAGDGSAKVTGTCEPPKTHGEPGQVHIGCIGKVDCTFLAGVCASEKGSFKVYSWAGATGGTCSYTPQQAATAGARELIGASALTRPQSASSPRS